MNEKVNKMLKMYKSTWLFYYNKIKLMLIPFIKIETLIPNEGFIIDLGCSHGLFANMIALNSEKREVLGLDINKKRIEHANIGIKNASFKAGDITKIEIPKADCIILTHVIHHIPLYEDQIKLLRSCYDKLKIGGKIIIVELDKFPKWKYLMCLITDKLLYPLDKTNYRSSENLQDLLKKYNFEVEAIPMHFRSIYSHITYMAKKI